MSELCFGCIEHMAGLDFTRLEGKALHLFNLPSIPTWQLLVVGGIISWLLFARATDLTRRLRTYWQPYVIRHVGNGALVVLRIQVPFSSNLCRLTIQSCGN